MNIYQLDERRIELQHMIAQAQDELKAIEATFTKDFAYSEQNRCFMPIGNDDDVVGQCPECLGPMEGSTCAEPSCITNTYFTDDNVADDAGSAAPYTEPRS